MTRKRPAQPSKLTLNDLKAVTRVFGVPVEDLFELAQKTEPWIEELKSCSTR